MMSKDFPSLREWIKHLALTDRLAVTREGVALEYELAALAKRLDGERAVWFPAPSGHPMPVVSCLVSDRNWIAEALGSNGSTLLSDIDAATVKPVPWREVEVAEVQQQVHKPPLDIRDLLPLPTHAEHDSGPYITAGLFITRNPTTGIQNVSINRLQPNGPQRLGVLILPRHAHAFYSAAEARDESLPVAIVIGVDPTTLICSQAILPIDHDELEVAGALRGEPVPVVKCLTNDVRVPANAEIVIEGRVLAKVREPEGPFGEFPQAYGPRSDKHVIQIDAVTHRTDPIYQTIVGGGLEHLLLGAIPREATLLAHLRRSFVNVLDVHMGLGGVGRYHLWVKVSKPKPGEAKNIIACAFGGHYDIKQVIVVDEDVDVHDPREVEWAVATRFQADRDLVVISNAQGSRLDPSSDNGISAKMGLDATVPPDADPFRYLRIHTPGEDSINLQHFLANPDSVDLSKL